MSTIQAYLETLQFNRSQTLNLLKQIVEIGNPEKVLGWRPGTGRAHIAWQCTHIGVTEEIFGLERLADRRHDARHANLWDRFKGGSTPDDDIPSIDLIQQVLTDGRETMLETLADFADDQLDTFTWVHPRLGKELSLRTTLQIINWHEGHHQGQAHITLNLYKSGRTV